MLTIIADKATDHHGKYNPAAKLNIAVNKTDEINFILFLVNH